MPVIKILAVEIPEAFGAPVVLVDSSYSGLDIGNGGTVKFNPSAMVNSVYLDREGIRLNA